MYGDRQQIQAAATATGDGTSFHVRKWAVTVFSITGTFEGTITFEGTVDGANWSSIQVHNLSNGNVSTTATATGLYGCNVLGLGDVRARISTYTSGTISVEVRGVDEGSGESLADISIAPDEVLSVDDNDDSLTVDQPLRWLLQTNAHIHVHTSDVSAANPVPVSHIGCVSTVNLIHDHFNVNANLQVGDTDVDAANPVPVSMIGEVSVIGTIGAMLEGGLTELIGINEQVDQNDYSGSIGVPLGDFYSGEILSVMLYSTEDGSGAVQTPEGWLYCFDVDPTIASGDTAMSAAERLTILGRWKVETTDWEADANGGTAYIFDTPVAFHAMSTLFFAFKLVSATSINSAGGDDEQIEFNFWFRRES